MNFSFPGMGGYGLYGVDLSFLILIPAIIFVLYAQAKVNGAYRKYAEVRNRKGITGQQAARMILDRNGLRHVPVLVSEGRLSDHYDPRQEALALSPKVYHEASVASVSIAAHEAGHAIQHREAYGPLMVRNAIVPVVNIVSRLAWPLLIIGIIISNAGYYMGGNLLFNAGILFFLAVVAFHLVTLPVELNASKRAISQLNETGIILYEEKSAAQKMLNAAAMTYLAALAMAVANLIRILAMRKRG